MKKLILNSCGFIGLISLSIIGHVSADNTNSNLKTSTASNVSANDADFFQKAAQIGLFELRAAEVASTRAIMKNTKSYASMLAMEHNKNNDQLKALAASKNVQLPDQLNDDHQKHLKDLQKENYKDFDESYIEEMIEGHKDAIYLFEKTAKDSKDADIRAYANNTLPALKKHLQAAQAIDKKN
ncbi:MAG: DUF4142 domain-containing protein [Gammaproteobacteria bacterium]|nr:DUF4142 domain-containing protein [Gammaproteobacteria bacterium]